MVNIMWRPTLGLESGYRLSGFAWDKGIYHCHTSRGCEPLSLSSRLKCSFCTTITEPSIYLSYRHRNHGAPSEVARDKKLSRATSLRAPMFPKLMLECRKRIKCRNSLAGHFQFECYIILPAENLLHKNAKVKPNFSEPCVILFSSREVTYNISHAVSYEVRAHWNANRKAGKYQTFYGLSCFSPVINIMRHPLWGRNQVIDLFTTQSKKISIKLVC